MSNSQIAKLQFDGWFDKNPHTKDLSKEVEVFGKRGASYVSLVKKLHAFKKEKELMPNTVVYFDEQKESKTGKPTLYLTIFELVREGNTFFFKELHIKLCSSSVTASVKRKAGSVQMGNHVIERFTERTESNVQSLKDIFDFTKDFLRSCLFTSLGFVAEGVFHAEKKTVEGQESAYSLLFPMPVKDGSVLCSTVGVREDEWFEINTTDFFKYHIKKKEGFYFSTTLRGIVFLAKSFISHNEMKNNSSQKDFYESQSNIYIKGDVHDFLLENIIKLRFDYRSGSAAFIDNKHSYMSFLIRAINQIGNAFLNNPSESLKSNGRHLVHKNASDMEVSDIENAWYDTKDCTPAI